MPSLQRWFAPRIRQWLGLDTLVAVNEGLRRDLDHLTARHRDLADQVTHLRAGVVSVNYRLTYYETADVGIRKLHKALVRRAEELTKIAEAQAAATNGNGPHAGEMGVVE